MTPGSDHQDKEIFLEQLISDLFHLVRASRVTLRQRRTDPEQSFPVTVEIAADGVKRLMEQGEADLTNDPVFNSLKGGGKMAVIDDCALYTAGGQVSTIVDLYGIKSEIVAPVRVNGCLAAIISVHETRGPRKWTPEDVSAVVRMTNEIARFLAS